MSAADIYASELLTKKLGFALWEPDPGTSASVEIADIGYILEGAFIRLFNASKDEAHPINEFGVPTPYTPLVIGPVHNKTPLSSGPISSESVNGHAVGVNLQGGPWVQVGGGFNFRCETRRGAALVLGDVGYREDALRLQHFITYASTYQKSWLEFANNPENGRGIALDDLILVTGWVKTSAWGCIAFSDRSQNSGVTFQAGQAVVAGGLIWGSWQQTHAAVDKHSGPLTLIPPDGSHINNNPPQPNQCVFLRGFKCCDRLTYILRKVRVWNAVNDGFKSVYPRLVIGTSAVDTSSTDRAAQSRSVNNATTIDSPASEQLVGDNAGPNVDLTSGEILETRRPNEADILDAIGDDQLNQFLQLNSDSERSLLDHLLYYILEVSEAQLAIIHSDDLDILLTNDTNILEPENWIRGLCPAVHVDENKVGMLDVTYGILYPHHTAAQKHKAPEQTPPVPTGLSNFSPVATPSSQLSTGSFASQVPIPTFIPHSPVQVISFKKKQEEYFSNMLGSKWGCSTPGHTVCVLIEGGHHRQVSEHDLSEWVKALCTGEATTAEPPEWMMKGSSNPARSSSDRGLLEARPVAIPPSRSEGHKPSKSFSLGRSRTSNYFSGVPSVGHYGDRALKWIGEKTQAVEELIIIKRCHEHQTCLKKWQSVDGVETTAASWAEKRLKIFTILEEALDLSRACYSLRVNKAAYRVGRELQRWLKLHPSGPFIPETAAWLALVQICLLPLLLSRIARKDPRAYDLSWDILQVLHRTPLHLHDSKSISPAICIVVKGLTYSPYTFRYSWLGVNLRSIIITILQARPLTPEELSVVHEMAARRLYQPESQAPESCRPWEVAIFADCTMQDQNLKDIVSGPHGVDSLLSILHRVVDEPAPDRELKWEPLSYIVHALSFLSEHGMVTKLWTEKTAIILLKVLSLRIPMQWFCIWVWAMDTIRNVIRHHPSTLDTLVRENARDTFTQVLSPSQPRGPTVSSTLLSEYRKEADDCANDLLEKIARWTTSPSRGSENAIMMETHDFFPSRLWLSSPSVYGEGASPMSSESLLNSQEYPWAAQSVRSKLSRDSMDNVVGDGHAAARKSGTFDPLVAKKSITPEEPEETRWNIDVVEFPWAVESGLPIEETISQ